MVTFFSSLLLLGSFLLLLLLLLMFCAQVYHTQVSAAEENNQLRTTMAYLNTKLRQHNEEKRIWIGKIGDLPAFCLSDTIDEKDFTTYIYLDGRDLKELFTASGNLPDPALGSTLVSLKHFDFCESSKNLYCFSITDSFGHSGTLYFDAGVP